MLCPFRGDELHPVLVFPPLLLQMTVAKALAVSSCSFLPKNERTVGFAIHSTRGLRTEVRLGCPARCTTLPTTSSVITMPNILEILPPLETVHMSSRAPNSCFP